MKITEVQHIHIFLSENWSCYYSAQTRWAFHSACIVAYIFIHIETSLFRKNSSIPQTHVFVHNNM